MKINLTEKEKRELVKRIEEGKPLPDQYRFLLFEDKKEVELVWNGKTQEVTNIVLPFQTIEIVDEPRAEQPADAKSGDVKTQFDLFDERGRQMAGWTNKLIWGDNKLILSSLKNGPLREEIEKAGGLKLIYIDPPFDVGADFSLDIEIGDETLTKEPNVLEDLAYRDTWGKGTDSFIAMIYERLSLMRDLLADDGSIYVHCDWRVNSYIRLAMDEIFGKDNFVNEIVWHYEKWTAPSKSFQKNHDVILFYSKLNEYNFKVQKKLTENLKKKYEKGYLIGGGYGSNGLVVYDKENSKVKQMIKSGKYKVHYAKKEGKPLSDVWSLPIINPQAEERLNYPTQKPRPLLERIIKASSNQGDLVADFFCGSGTLAEVAEQEGRKWICADLGKFAIHTTRKRMIDVQRKRKESGKNYRAFEILNLGKYERQHYIGVNLNLNKKLQEKQLAEKEENYIKLIIRAYSAQPAIQSSVFQGKKSGRMVCIGPINLPLSRLYVEEVIKECKAKKVSQVDILAFEFEMGLFPNIRDEAKKEGIDLALKYIPKDVFDKRAVEKNEVVFHDVSYVDFKVHVKKGAIAVQLTDFSTYYSQGESMEQIKKILKNGKTKIVVENGKIFKVSKDKEGKFKKELITKKWLDWIDYWSVDFDFESKKEFIKIKDSKTNKIKEQWTGDYIFENEWQSFRTKKNRSLELKTPSHEISKSKVKIAVKVIDIFGNDTMKIKEVKL